MDEYIRIKGARVNNLKDISIDIPRDKFIVITGLSGSGKSSLAFDTLYAEGQRRYVESLSAYARQFLGRMQKPDCDAIEGLPPAIAIEQKVTSRNPRSTVGTSTEIYDYLRMLFARIGRTYSPISGEEVKRHSPEDVVQCALSYPQGTRFTVLSPIHLSEERTLRNQLEIYLQEGYARIDLNGEILRIEDVLNPTEEPDGGKTNAPLDLQHYDSEETKLYLIVDRMAVIRTEAEEHAETGGEDKDEEYTSFLSRLTDSIETALYEGDGICLLRFYPSRILHEFSTRFEADGMHFDEPSDQMFSFNSPLGACPECEGFGKIVGIDEALVIPDKTLSVYDGAVVCWRGDKMSEWKKEFCRRAAAHDFPIFEPYYKLTNKQKNYLWHGSEAERARPKTDRVYIDAFFDMLRENQYKIQYRVMLARYRGKTTCPVCHGTRLKKEAEYVRINGRTITELVEIPVKDLLTLVQNLSLTNTEKKIGERLLREITSRLQFLVDVGLGYLTLNRSCNTLSGGESQRIALATSLGSSLVGSLYILDEPSIGLHSRDTERLIKVLRQLQQLQNTVIVVEHDEEIIRAADYLIDIGPDAGRRGGDIVYKGTLTQLPTGSNSHTLHYLLGEEKIAIPSTRRAWNHAIEVKGARENNLRGIDVKFPLNVMTVVTGVSGSGKSTLVNQILYRAVKRHLDESCERPGEHLSLEGDLDKIKNIEFVDQNPIGKSSRSNPATYIKVYDDIRRLMAEQPLAKQMDFTAGTFSFNTDGGRCEECKGEGIVKIEMQFMADLMLECESCHGKRFKPDVLEVRFAGKNIHEILDMTVNAAIEFFDENGQKSIAKQLKPLQDVGLGYIKLGQSSSTLSGGENQRVKLAYYLRSEKVLPTLFIFDEPTTGLHFHDIHKLIEAFNALLLRGHSIIIIEHNMEIIKTADWIIDLGPEGGAEGGQLVCCGTPEQVARCKSSYTGKYLAQKLDAFEN